MAAPRLFCSARVCGSLSFVAFLLVHSVLLGQEWQHDIPFASCSSGAACGYCSCRCCDNSCCCGTASCTNCGYCWNGPCLTDGLTNRIMCEAEAMQARGITYAPVATQFYQGVTSGGREQDFEYGGKLDQFLILDSGKLGLWQGMTMTLHAETRLGQDVNFDAVGFAPANVAMLYPKFNEHDTAITGLSFAQALNEELQLTFGKFNALDLFYSLYPQTGRGINGFMNASMVIPISVARVAPLSFLGAGVLQYHEKQVQSGLLVYDTHNVPTTSGFDELFDNGANIMGFWRFFTDLGGLPGSQMVGGIWSTGEFVSFDPAGFVIVPDDGLVAARESGAYTLIGILEQTLWMDCCRRDRNIALLTQWGLADEETSPIRWSANVGLQGKGVFRSRPHDAMGVGYFYTGLSDEFRALLSPIRNLHHVTGVELYYTAAVTKCFHLTTDLQVIEPADVALDTAVVFGLRGTLGL